MAGAERAGAEQPVAHALQDRPGPLHRRFLVRADHDGERPVLRLRRAAADRRVDQARTVFGERRAERAGADRFGRTHIDDEAAGSEPAGQRAALRFQQHLPDDGTGRQHGHDDGRGAGQRSQRRRDPAAGQCGEGFGGVRVGIVADRLEGGAGQIGGHRPAHGAQTDEADDSLEGSIRPLLFPYLLSTFLKTKSNLEIYS